MKRTVAFALLLALAGDRAAGSDKEGRFAVEGAGSTRCSQYLVSWQAASKTFYAYGGWIEGYVTASNQYLPDTYDLTPWENTNHLAALLANHCRRHPDQAFISAVRLMIKALREERLEESSPVILAKSGTKGTRLYRAVLRRVQAALKREGLYTGEVDGAWEEQTREALLAYQRRERLETSGLPDQKTLMGLLR